MLPLVCVYSTEIDIQDGRVFQTVAVPVVCQQVAKEQRSANVVEEQILIDVVYFLTLCY